MGHPSRSERRPLPGIRMYTDWDDKDDSLDKSN